MSDYYKLLHLYVNRKLNFHIKHMWTNLITLFFLSKIELLSILLYSLRWNRKPDNVIKQFKIIPENVKNK